MPAILPDDGIDTWLDPAISDLERLSEFLKAPPEDFLDSYPVDAKLVNSARIDVLECVNPINLDFTPLFG
jgi:hypothetical protein